MNGIRSVTSTLPFDVKEPISSCLSCVDREFV